MDEARYIHHSTFIIIILINHSTFLNSEGFFGTRRSDVWSIVAVSVY
jgi:hypothetical protein